MDGTGSVPGPGVGSRARDDPGSEVGVHCSGYGVRVRDFGVLPRKSFSVYNVVFIKITKRIRVIYQN